MITLELLEPQWIKGPADDPKDLCAHGKIRFIVENLVIDDGAEEWTVSTAALFLLRTISNDHTEKESVVESNYLIPCCGHKAWLCGERFPVMVMGCNHGLNPEIRHFSENVEVQFNNEKVTVPLECWAKAIVGFVEQVQQFYNISSPKAEIEDEYDRQGWEAFWDEWRTHLSAAKAVASGT